MAIKQLDYWYDNQQRRFLEQVVRAFSGFQYMSGYREVNGRVIQPQLRTIPCTMAATDRMVGHIMRNNSENTAMSAPRITVAHVGLTGRRADVQFPGHIDTRHVNERAIDPATNQYTDAAGRSDRSYTVLRMMPRPFDMQVNVDIWTTNWDQKYQIVEQILTVVYPDFQIQNSDNALDWTAMTMMELTDINWSSQSIPVGTSDEIDICTLTFRIPILLSPPAKVQQQRIIEQIIANVHDARHDEDGTAQNLMFQQIITPGDHILQVRNGIVRLLGSDGSDVDPSGKTYDWKSYLNQFGLLQPAISTIRLKTSPEQIDDWSHDIIGTLQYDASNPDQLFWQLDPDTLPGNTQSPIDGLIDPLRTFPGEGLPGQANGQRYIVMSDVGGPSQAWGNLRAHQFDIIEYSQGSWTVSYTPTRGAKVPDYVLNLKSGNQLRWNGEAWIKSIDGDYPPGYWRLKL